MIYGPYPGVVRDNHDGDTLGVDLDLGFAVAVTTRSLVSGNRLLTCRLYGINAPELEVRDPVTGKFVQNPDGYAARDYLTSLVPAGTAVRVVSHGWDAKEGRFDGSVTRASDGLGVNQAMIDSGHAVPM